MEAQPFELFGSTHLLTAAITLILAVVLPLAARRLPAREARLLALALATGLVLYRTGWMLWTMAAHGAELRQVIPLGICPALFYLCAWVLWRRDQAVYEVAYYWALSGALMSVITPDVPVSYPHPQYIAFFASHGSLILAVLYATFVFGMRPRWSSIPRVTAITVVYALVLMVINALLGTNHMYVNGKPASASLLDFLGPWPWYIVTGIGLALALFSLSYAPFFLADRWGRGGAQVVGRSAGRSAGVEK